MHQDPVCDMAVEPNTAVPRMAANRVPLPYSRVEVAVVPWGADLSVIEEAIRALLEAHVQLSCGSTKSKKSDVPCFGEV